MAENPTVKLGVLISGSGTNLQAIIDAILHGDLKAEVRLVISNRAEAQGLERARRPRRVAGSRGRAACAGGLYAVAVAGDARSVCRPHHEYSQQPAAVVSWN